MLNRLKKDDLGEKGFEFSEKEFNYYCNPNNCSKSYRTFCIPKKTGGNREISAPARIHKSMLVYANRILQACYEPTNETMGFVPGRSVVDNAKRHVGQNYVLNIDLKDFFPSIVQARVWAVLQLKPFYMNADVAGAFAELCCVRVPDPEGKKKRSYKYVLPQGSPASPMLTNIVCRKLDRRLAGLARRFNLRYTRYADDITFSSNHNVYSESGEFMVELRRIISDQNFMINEKKTRLQKKGGRQEVTGLVVNEKVNVIKKYLRSLNCILYIWERYGYVMANRSFMKHYHGKITNVSSIERVIQGKLMYLKMVKGENDRVYMKFNDRFTTLLKTLKSSSGFGSDLRFTMKIADYEEFSKNTVHFKCSKADSNGDSNVYAVIKRSESEEKNELVRLTGFCRKEVGELLELQESEKLDALKKIWFISLYERKDGGFWRIQRCSPLVLESNEKKLRALYIGKMDSMGNVSADDDLYECTVNRVKDNEQTLSDNKSTDAMTHEQLMMLSTDEVIDRLIESNGDLNILDRWDIRKSI